MCSLEDKQLLETLHKENQMIILGNKRISRMLASVTKVMVQDSCPRPPSNTTERNYHKVEMKQAARQRYQCIHPTDPSQTKCMLLGLYFPTNQVICSHIISVRNRNALSRLGISDNCKPKKPMSIRVHIIYIICARI